MKIALKKIEMINIYHLVIWIILILFKLTVDYSIFGSFFLGTNLKVFLVFIALFYANYCLFLPFLIKQNPFTRIAIIATIVVVYTGLFIFLMPERPPFPPRNFPPPKNMPFDPGINFRDIIFKIGLFSLIFSTLLFFADQWLENQKMIETLEYERQSSELKILREQINPHFFFNALNSIYSLAITQSKDTPKVILILSDIMRYILNENKGQKSNLSDEIDNIKKYIEIQSIRFNRFNNISSHFSGEFSRNKIEPLLLLTFIENAFKYADFTKGPIEIDVQVIDNRLSFRIMNFFDNKHIDLGNGNKMGIKNTQQKLDLLYPNQYDLEINESDSVFEIKLHINLD